MLAARARFLRRGHFDPLVGEVARAVLAERMRVPSLRKAPFTVLDAGCGDGHYLAAVAEALADAAPGTDAGTHAHTDESLEVRSEAGHLLMGFDLSREAVRRAARTIPKGFFFVNDVAHRICLADDVVDVILDVFAPRNPREFARVLRPGGALLIVLPDEEHLKEARARMPLLGIEPEKRERTMKRLAHSLRFEGESTVRHSVHLGGAELRDLVCMSPSFWHITPEDLDSIEGEDPLRVTVNCHLLRFRKDAIPAPDTRLGTVDAVDADRAAVSGGSSGAS